MSITLVSVSNNVQYCRYLRIIIYGNYYPVSFIRKVCKCNICLTGKMKSYSLRITILLEYYKPLQLNNFNVLLAMFSMIKSQNVSIKQKIYIYEYVYILRKGKLDQYT